MKKLEVYLIDYYEVEKLVAKTFDVNDYDFAATEECNNNTMHLYCIGEIKELDTYKKDKLAQFIAKEGVIAYVNYILMQELVNRGILQPANYLVRVSW